jgi:hypothetical protein
MDNVQKPSNPKCYTPLLEPFRIYLENVRNLLTGYLVLITFEAKLLMKTMRQANDNKNNYINTNYISDSKG